MASSTDNTLSAITSSVQPRFESDLTLQMNRAAPLLTLIQQKEWRASNVTFDVVTGAVTAGSMQENYTFNVANDMTMDHVQPCTLNWATQATALSLGDLQLDVLEASEQPSDLVRDHIAMRVMLSTEALCQNINLALYNSLGTTASPIFGTGTTTTILGLTPGFIDATANIGGAITSSTAAGQTYGGIVRATYTQATGSYFDNGLAGAGAPVAITTKLLSQMIQAVKTKSGRRPTCFVASPGVMVTLYELFKNAGNTRMIIDAMRPDIGPGFAQIGEAPMSFQGIPIIDDYTLGTQETTNGYGFLYLLNLDHLEVRYLPPRRREPAQQSREEGGVTEAAGPLGTGRIKNQLQVTVIKLAKTGDNESMYLRARLQLVNKLPAANAWMTNIAI